RNAHSYRQSLGAPLVKLAQIDLKLGAYDEAVRLALDVPKTVPNTGRAAACLEAARILARLVAQIGGDGRLAQGERDRLTDHSLGRAIILVREAIDTDPKLVEPIKQDPDIKALESRPEIQAILN